MDLWTPLHFIQRHGIDGLHDLATLLNSHKTLPIKIVMSRFGYGQSQSYNLINIMFERKYVLRESVKEVIRLQRSEINRSLSHANELEESNVLQFEPDELRIACH